MTCQEAFAEGIGLSKGGKQGSTETPWTWNALLDFLLAPTIQRWISDSLGFCLHDGLLNLSHAIWADDLTWVATSWGEAQSMSQDLTSAFGAGYLSWEPDSLALIASPAAREAMAEMGALGFLTTEGLDGTCFTFALVSQMPLLGVLLDGQGSINTSLEHRITASQAHFHARKAQLCCKLVPLPKRLARLYATVIQSLLWGSGGWALTRGLLRRLEAVEMSFLRRMLQLPRREGEGFVQYQKRSASVARDMLRKYNVESVAVRALKAKHGWAGHLARAPPSSPLGRLLRFRTLTWWKDAQDSLPKLDRHNYLKWRHSRPGRFLRWEHALHRYDEHLLFLAPDRETWKKASTLFSSSSSCNT